MPKLKKEKSRLVVNTVKSVNDAELSENMKFSFQYLDTTQKYGSGFADWQRVGLLSTAMETIRGYCSRPLQAQIGTDKFTLYGDFPPKDKTLFEKPAHVPPDARWARIHVNGSAVLIGHIVRDTFHVVFLDKTHKFWLTRRETGK